MSNKLHLSLALFSRLEHSSRLEINVLWQNWKDTKLHFCQHTVNISAAFLSVLAINSRRRASCVSRSVCLSMLVSSGDGRQMSDVRCSVGRGPWSAGETDQTHLNCGSFLLSAMEVHWNGWADNRYARHLIDLSCLLLIVCQMISSNGAVSREKCWCWLHKLLGVVLKFLLLKTKTACFFVKSVTWKVKHATGPWAVEINKNHSTSKQ